MVDCAVIVLFCVFLIAVVWLRLICEFGLRGCLIVCCFLVDLLVYAVLLWLFTYCCGCLVLFCDCCFIVFG